ncbi:MAG TPA: hypothetical protein VNJ03_16580 [Vicinamibacterales bacterium]|nr:hypothetical protein [Vicinamibacterales bacterium]
MDALVAQRSPGPRDRYDTALVHVLAHVSMGLPFTVAAMWRRRAVDQALASALLDCDVVSTRQAGKLLKRITGHAVDGVCVRRIGTTREGAVWHVSQE